MPLLFGVTFAICLPSFFVANTLLGLRPDFKEVLRALVQIQAGLSIVLLSLAPFTLLWYATSANYEAALVFNGCMFAVASVAGQILLRRHYQPLMARDPRHRQLLILWLVVFAFVGIQTAWVFRPFIGGPTRPVQFFREEAWGNAYVEVAGIFHRLATGRSQSID